jgi:two-component system sensor histidine kinase KdpD
VLLLTDGNPWLREFQPGFLMPIPNGPPRHHLGVDRKPSSVRSDGWRAGLLPLGGSIAAVVVVTGVVYLLREVAPVLSLGALYLLAILPVAVLWGRAYAVFVAVASMLAFNFFFLPPTRTFRLEERSNWVALAVYLVTGIVVSELASRARDRAAEAEQREQEEAFLAELSIALLQGERLSEDTDAVADALARVLHVTHVRLELDASRPLPAASALELAAGDRRIGTVVLPEGEQPDPAVRARFLPAFASLLAVAIDREVLENEALEAERLRLSDSVKTAILRSVSHDLRSPLTAIRVAGESLASPTLTLDAGDRERLLDTIREESRRLDRLVGNLLDLSRLQTGAVTPHRGLVALDELVGQALAQLGGREAAIRIELPDEIPVVDVDAIQIERALVNLLENALRYSPADEDVLVHAVAAEHELVLHVENRGQPLGAGDLERIFDPFERASAEKNRAGTGLGLAIARGFVEANGGRLWAESDRSEGACFALALPLAKAHVRTQA